MEATPSAWSLADDFAEYIAEGGWNRVVISMRDDQGVHAVSSRYEYWAEAPSPATLAHLGRAALVRGCHSLFGTADASAPIFELKCALAAVCSLTWTQFVVSLTIALFIVVSRDAVSDEGPSRFRRANKMTQARSSVRPTELLR